MTCILDDLIKVKDEPRTFAKDVENILRSFRLSSPLTVTLNSETPYIMKAIIDSDNYVIIINPIKLKKASESVVLQVLKKEFNKIFLAEIKLLTQFDNMLRFVSEFGFSITIWGKFYQTARTKFKSDIKATLLLSIVTLLFNLIYDKTVQKFIDKKVIQKKVYRKFWSHLSCTEEVFENAIPIHDKLLSEAMIVDKLIQYIIRKMKNLDTGVCKFLNFLFRISSKVFGPVAPISERLYNLQRKCEG